MVAFMGVSLPPSSASWHLCSASITTNLLCLPFSDELLCDRKCGAIWKSFSILSLSAYHPVCKSLRKTYRSFLAQYHNRGHHYLFSSNTLPNCYSFHGGGRLQTTTQMERNGTLQLRKHKQYQKHKTK